MDGIGDYSVFLQQARETVVELQDLEQRRDAAAEKLRQDMRLLENEKKAADDEIRRMTKKRLDSITSGYDKQISKSQDRLRKAKNRRESAKGKGVKERIADETAGLREENRRIRLQIKTLFQEHNVPRICNTRLYYALFLPRWPMDLLILLLTVVICFFALPGGIYLLIPNRKPFMLLLLCAVCVLLFGVIYVLVGADTKSAHMDTLKEGREMRGQIRANQKKIRSVTRTIKRDLNEDVYDLGPYDDEIARLRQELSDLTSKKKEAVNTFETVTKNVIYDEIMESHSAKLETLSASVQQGDREYKELEAAVKDRELRLTERYAPYLGHEFLTTERLDALLDIMKNGNAVNLTDAIQVYERSHT